MEVFLAVVFQDRIQECIDAMFERQVNVNVFLLCVVVSINQIIYKVPVQRGSQNGQPSVVPAWKPRS